MCPIFIRTLLKQFASLTQLFPQYAELDGKRNELSDLQQQRQALADHYAPHNILTRLKIAAADIEEESEVSVGVCVCVCHVC